jgi:hypothetical protein
MASTIPFQLCHLAVILFRLPDAGRAVAPILLSDLALTGLVIWWTWTGSFALNWRRVTFVWCCALVLSASAISVITLQSAPFYMALIMMVFGTAALAPWGVRWEASFILICLGAAVAVADGTHKGPDSFQLYRLIELGAASALAIFVAALNQRYRDAMTSSMSVLQANESQLWKVFDANPDAITIARLSDGQYLNVSAEFLTTGYSREEALSGSRIDLVLEDTDSPSNLAATGQNDVLVRLRPMQDGRNPAQTARFWLWAASDNLRLYAQNAVDCALDLRRLRPQGTVQ